MTIIITDAPQKDEAVCFLRQAGVPEGEALRDAAFAIMRGWQRPLMAARLCSRVTESDPLFNKRPALLAVRRDGTVLDARVIFRLTESRETGFLEELLAGYSGTIVSDFYGGYDALPYRQQKCLVHLIGDLNDDLWKNPFNVDFEQFVASVRDLLVPMLEDVRRYGLKACHLRKHRLRVKEFYRDSIDGKTDEQELVARYTKRFQRYRESMFAFLEADAIPWNNNAAERALRHLAVQRKISGAFSKKGATDYLRLLAISQTCRFQNKSFLGFLLSGRKNVDEFKDRRRFPIFQVPLEEE